MPGKRGGSGDSTASPYKHVYTRERAKLKLHEQIVAKGVIAAKQNAVMQAHDPRQRTKQALGGSNSKLNFGNLRKGWKSVAKEAVAPVTNFVDRPGLRTGVGLAEVFPWGTRMRAPKQWDLRSGGKVTRTFVKDGMWRFVPGSLEARYNAHDPAGRHIGESTIGMYPDNSYVDWVGTDTGATPSTMIDLLAPALNRQRVRGVPIDAQVVNPKLAVLMLKLAARNPGMFTDAALREARQTLGGP